jgi:peptide/nickel transport system substrate-binding protein
VRKLVAALGAVGLLALPLPVRAEAQQPTVLRVALTYDVDNLNPFLSITQAGTEIGRLMYDFLTAYDTEDQHPVEALADKWEAAPDKLTWTFHLPDGKKWSDGEPITSADVGYTYNLMMKDPTAATANGSFVANFESVTTPDDRTVVIKTKTPQSTMLALDVPIVPEHVWSKVGDLGTFQNNEPGTVGSGPFVLSEFRANEFVKLKANKDYWRGAPKYDELHFIQYKTVDAATQALSRGEVDLVNRLGAAQFDSLKSNQDVALNKAQGRRFYEVVLNSGAATKNGDPIGDGHPALRDVKVRQAIAKAIDLKTMVERVNGGYAELGTGPIPPVFPEFHFTPAQLRPFDPAAAGTELDALGYRKGADGIRAGADGRPLNFRLLGHAGRSYDEQAAEFIKRSLADLGIGVEVQFAKDDLLNESANSGKFDLVFSSWGTNPDPDYILSLHTCGQRPNADGKGGTTDTFFCDQTYDALYAQQLSELDRGKRADLVKQMQQRFYDQVPAVVLCYENSLEAYRKDKFGGFAVQPDPGGVIMGQNGVWGYYSATPVSASGGGSSSSAPVIIGVVAVVVLLGGGIWLVSRRRGTTAEDRE